MSLPSSLQDRHLTWNKMHPHLLTWIPPRAAVLPSNPPSHPSSLPKYTYVPNRASIFTTLTFCSPRLSPPTRPPVSNRQRNHQPSQNSSSPAVSPPDWPKRSGAEAPAAAATKNRRAHNNGHPPKKGEAGAEGPGHCTSETRMVSDTTSAKHGTCPCPPFISSP